jgi:hypothetical protein
MFINSQVGLLLPEKLANSAALAAGLSQASGSAGGIIQATGAAFGGLIGAAVSALSEKHLAGVETTLVIAAIGGLAWRIATALLAAGGATTTSLLRPLTRVSRDKSVMPAVCGTAAFVGSFVSLRLVAWTGRLTLGTAFRC